MTTISKINGIVVANIAKINGIVKANISKVNGISFGPAWVSPTAIHSECLDSLPYRSYKTIDGDLGWQSMWAHSEQHEHWIIFDLGATKTVEKVRLYCNGTVARDDLCEVSAIYINDTADESGGSKGSGSISSGLGWKEIDVTDTSGRYIKLKLKTYTTVGDCVITMGLTNFYEFEAYVS